MAVHTSHDHAQEEDAYDRPNLITTSGQVHGIHAMGPSFTLAPGETTMEFWRVDIRATIQSRRRPDGIFEQMFATSELAR